MESLFIRWKEVFSREPGCTSVYEHDIVPRTSNLKVRKSYPVPLAQEEAVDRDIQRMLDMGVIEPSTSSFCNPLRIVNKKN